ncbi:MAG: hypothetical protein ACAH17_01865 [Candidatus Paceibacterota bacterium]
MQKFLILFLTPVSVLENWMNTPEEERKAVEEKMKQEWDAWITNNKSSIVDMPAGAGKTKLINTTGITDTKNDVMMYAVVQANSHEEAAKMFEGHPHLGIPEASIEVMTINTLTGMNQ